jgi:hypothetical protein
MRFGSLPGQSSDLPSDLRRRRGGGRRRWPLGAVAGALILVGCEHSTAAAPPTSAIATTTTSTTEPAVSKLTVVGVRAGVNQAPFYPQITVAAVSCGVAPQGGRFVRIDLPAGAAGTPAKSVLTNPTAVLVAPGGAVLVDPRYITRPLYAEAMKSVATAKEGAFVLTLHNVSATGGDKLSVVAGNVQIYGDYQCPGTDVAYPGT